MVWTSDGCSLRSTLSRAIRKSPSLNFAPETNGSTEGTITLPSRVSNGAKQDHLHGKTFELDADEPPLLLGEDKGPNPVEYILKGLAACLTTSLVYHAAAKGIEVKGVESRLEGDLDLRGFLGISEEVPVGYQKIRVFFKVDADVSDAQKEELIQMAQKYSPVFNTVSNPTPVAVKLDR